MYSQDRSDTILWFTEMPISPFSWFIPPPGQALLCQSTREILQTPHIPFPCLIPVSNPTDEEVVRKTLRVPHAVFDLVSVFSRGMRWFVVLDYVLQTPNLLHLTQLGNEASEGTVHGRRAVTIIE